MFSELFPAPPSALPSSPAAFRMLTGVQNEKQTPRQEAWVGQALSVALKAPWLFMPWFNPKKDGIANTGSGALDAEACDGISREVLELKLLGVPGAAFLGVQSQWPAPLWVSEPPSPTPHKWFSVTSLPRSRAQPTNHPLHLEPCVSLPWLTVF